MVFYFIYGTLRKGEYNHALIENERYIGKSSLKGYAIYNLGLYPGISEKAGEKVIGELYDIKNSETELNLDHMELGAGYRKKLVKVSCKGKTFMANVYIFLGADDYEPIESGDWMDKKDLYGLGE